MSATFEIEEQPLALNGATKRECEGFNEAPKHSLFFIVHLYSPYIANVRAFLPSFFELSFVFSTYLIQCYKSYHEKGVCKE
ncbi:hypothetical protein BBD42_19330 [Paenibacillus sp. BIHB 4019]|uniref:Uncharacterized protein n=1 Tax=Paenibacillus sp. BIHB 4019 TaxID=1870819 RepID=A0A1B2DKZ9_9BACL|nr:hypothetical protein BBD42_19330 [Paenibacillus sp. BIHB 4019]